MTHRTGRDRILVALLPAILVLAACGPPNSVTEGAGAASNAGRLVLDIESAETVAEGRSCAFAVTARNDTGGPALNVQAAWMAQTDGFGFISDYQMLGDFTAGEARPFRLGVVGAPCHAVLNLALTRAVCVVGPAQDPPQSCADRVVLDGDNVVVIRAEN